MAGEPTLREHSRGDWVRHLQSTLAAQGYGPGAADGIFGPHTHAAVVAFQQAHHLGADGIVGHQTWAALERGSSAPAAGRHGGEHHGRGGDGAGAPTPAPASSSAAGAAPVATPTPHLTLIAGPTAHAGDQGVSVEYAVTNQGQGQADPATIIDILWVIGADGSVAHSETVPHFDALPGGQSYVNTFHVPAGALPAGTYRVVVQIDMERVGPSHETSVTVGAAVAASAATTPAATPAATPDAAPPAAPADASPPAAAPDAAPPAAAPPAAAPPATPDAGTPPATPDAATPAGAPDATAPPAADASAAAPAVPPAADTPPDGEPPPQFLVESFIVHPDGQCVYVARNTGGAAPPNETYDLLHVIDASAAYLFSDSALAPETVPTHGLRTGLFHVPVDTLPAGQYTVNLVVDAGQSAAMASGSLTVAGQHEAQELYLVQMEAELLE